MDWNTNCSSTCIFTDCMDISAIWQIKKFKFSSVPIGANSSFFSIIRHENDRYWNQENCDSCDDHRPYCLDSPKRYALLLYHACYWENNGSDNVVFHCWRLLLHQGLEEILHQDDGFCCSISFCVLLLRRHTAMVSNQRDVASGSVSSFNKYLQIWYIAEFI